MKKILLDQPIRDAVRVLKAGGVIALPTETTYGLACDPRNPEAVRKIFRIKGRAEGKPLQLIASSFAQVERLARLSRAERALADRHWPGPLTLLLRLRSGRKLAARVSPKSVIGIRVTSSPVAKRVAAAFGHPIAATSANRSGRRPAFSGAGVRRAFALFPDKPDGILDIGTIPRRRPSTVARVRSDETVEILRVGAIKNL